MLATAGGYMFKCHVIVIGDPGHRDPMKNMSTDTPQADFDLTMGRKKEERESGITFTVAEGGAWSAGEGGSCARRTHHKSVSRASSKQLKGLQQQRRAAAASMEFAAGLAGKSRPRTY